MTVRRVEAQVEVTSLRHVRVFREDLAAIARALLEVGPLSGTCADVQFDDPADFERMAGQLPERLPTLTMMTEAPKKASQPKGPKVEVVLSRDAARVTLTEPTTLTLGVRDRVMQIATRSERRVVNVLGSSSGTRRFLTWAAVAYVVWWLISQPVSAAHLAHNAGELLSSGQIPSAKTLLLLIGVIAAITLLVFGISRLPAAPSSAVMINAPRALRRSFWVRQRDAMIISAVSLILGGVIGYLINILASSSSR